MNPSENSLASAFAPNNRAVKAVKSRTITSPYSYLSEACSNLGGIQKPYNNTGIAFPLIIGPFSSKMSETAFACLPLKTFSPVFSRKEAIPVNGTSLPSTLFSAVSVLEVLPSSTFWAVSGLLFIAFSAAVPFNAGFWPFVPQL